MLLIAICIYAVSMTLANLLVTMFGPSITPLNAFVLIGLDLALRDWLHIKLKPWQMGTLIIGSGLLTYAFNPEAGQIAFASACAFTVSSLVDWATFAKLKGSWLIRANGSNIAGAAIDSLLFPTIAFGSLMPEIVAAQFIAKTVGGAAWAYLLKNRMPT